MSPDYRACALLLLLVACGSEGQRELGDASDQAEDPMLDGDAGDDASSGGDDLDAADLGHEPDAAVEQEADAGEAGSTLPGGDAGSTSDAGARADAAADASTSDAAAPSWNCSAGAGLRCAGARPLIGSAINVDALGDAMYRDVLAREFNYVTPENVTKWSLLEPARASWTFEEVDRLFATAGSNLQPVKGHAFVWHQRVPTWAESLSRADLLSALREHVTTVATRYRTRARAWDVVNEAIDDTTLQLRAGIHTTLGVAGMADVFKWARAADPQALLYYNDYGGDALGPKADAIYNLVKQLQAAGAPIDGVGFQSHLWIRAFPSEDSLRANLRRFAQLGLKLNISELDVRTTEISGDAATRLSAQRVVYQLVSAVCASEPACESLTTWGFSDAYSWIDGTYGADDPLPFSDSYQTKPAYQGLMAGLRGTLPAKASNVAVNGNCDNGTTGWIPSGGGSVSSYATGRSGAACAMTGRTQAYQGPAQSLLGKLSPGQVFSATVWVRVNVASAPVKLSLKSTLGGVDTFYPLARGTVSNTAWTMLSGAATFPSEPAPSEFELYVEGPPANVELRVDDLSIQRLTTP